MTTRWRRTAVIAVVVIALIVGARFVWQRVRPTQDCTAEAVVYEGVQYGRDPSRGCRLVNDDGETLPEE